MEWSYDVYNSRGFSSNEVIDGDLMRGKMSGCPFLKFFRSLECKDNRGKYS